MKYSSSFEEGQDVLISKDKKSLFSELELNNLVYEQDYALTIMSNGAAISSNGEITIFEIPIANIEKLKVLDVNIEFEGVLGETYYKQVFCIPRNGIQNHNSKIIQI